MRKRGNLVVLTAFSLIAGALILVLFQKVAYSLATNEQFYVKFQVNEIKYLMHTLYATPGNVIIYYPENTSTYIYDFDVNSLEIRKSDIDTKWEKMKIFLVPIMDQQIQKKIEHRDELVFSKIGNQVNVDGMTNLNRISCPSKTKDVKKGMLLLYPVENSIEIDKKTGTEITKEVTDALQKRPEPFGAALIAKGKEEEVLAQISDSTDVFLVIDIGTYPGNENPMKIFITENSAEASRLACLIINSVLEEFPITGFSIVPSNEKLLNKNEIGLRIEIGNSNIENNPLFAEPDKVSAQIRKAFNKV